MSMEQIDEFGNIQLRAGDEKRFQWLTWLDDSLAKKFDSRYSVRFGNVNTPL